MRVCKCECVCLHHGERSDLSQTDGVCQGHLEDVVVIVIVDDHNPFCPPSLSFMHTQGVYISSFFACVSISFFFQKQVNQTNAGFMLEAVWWTESYLAKYCNNNDK